MPHDAERVTLNDLSHNYLQVCGITSVGNDFAVRRLNRTLIKLQPL